MSKESGNVNEMYKTAIRMKKRRERKLYNIRYYKNLMSYSDIHYVKQMECINIVSILYTFLVSREKYCEYLTLHNELFITWIR